MKTIPASAHLKGVRHILTYDGIAKAWLDGKLLSLNESLKYCSKSPKGFDWGNDGGGASQLAHEICRQLYGLETARRVFQSFKQKHIEPIQLDSFELVIDLTDFNREHVCPQ